MRRLLSLTLIAPLLAACGVFAGADPSGTLFRTTVASPDGSYVQEVVLGDQTGLVTGIEPVEIVDASGFDPPTIEADEGQKNTLVFRWANGACDRPAISFVRLQDHLSIKVSPRPQGGACMAILLFRAVRIHFKEPVDPATIEVASPR
ncbi:MAG: hypothetical protein ABUL57_01055 [Chloroflexota bacterium]